MKPYTLTNREGESISPLTSTKTVFDENGVDLDTKLSQQKQDNENALKEYAKTTEVAQNLAGKQDKLTTTTDLNITDDNILGLTDKFKDSKLDKNVFDASFTIKGCRIEENGLESVVTQWESSEYIPINRAYNVKLTAYISASVSAVKYYDETRLLVGTACQGALAAPSLSEFVVEPSDIPENAVYIRFTALAHTQNKYTYLSTAESRTGAVASAIAASKKALFIDQYNAAFDKYGKYDPVNAPDPRHPFYGNEIWMTYEEAVESIVALAKYKTGQNVNVRTLPPMNLLPSGYGNYTLWNGLFTDMSRLESVRFIGGHTIMGSTFSNYSFRNNLKLKSILGVCNLQSTPSDIHGFQGMNALENIQFKNLKSNIAFKDSPLLSLASIQYLVTNAANTSAITITVHPDVYAKLTGDTTNAAAAELADEEAAAWLQLLTDAAEKNIIFTTI